MEKVNLIINNVIEELKNITGIEALVLGGSRARGVYSKTSDIDIGIYYNEFLDIKKLNEAAQN